MSHANYCVKHSRFVQMRNQARHDGKVVPSFEQLECLATHGMTCRACNRLMNWLKREGPSTVLTLQHDRGGTLRFICQGCNTKHRCVPDDRFYSIPDGSKYCAGCDSMKPLEAFARDKQRGTGRKSRCRECCKDFYNANRGYWQQWGRERRAAIA